MDPIADFGEVIENIKNLRDADVGVQTAGSKDQLADIYIKLADLRQHMYELLQKNIQINQTAEIQKAFQVHPLGYYVLRQETHGYKPGNYCPVCFGKNKSGDMIPLKMFGTENGTCPACNVQYYSIVGPGSVESDWDPLDPNRR